MTGTPPRAFSPARIALAWGVHLFTASGGVLGALALLSIGTGEFPRAALLMIGALVIDSVDGTLARAVGVAEVLPGIDGRRLDDVIDYLNFVIVPVIFMAASGSVPGWAWSCPPVIASSYGFSQRDAKTEDDFFLGWPSYWNVLALYLWLLDFGTTAGALWVSGLSVAVFVPLKYAYPSKLAEPFFRHTLNWGGFVWALLLVVGITAPALSADLHLVEISLSYLVYYMAVSIWLGDWRRGWS